MSVKTSAVFQSTSSVEQRPVVSGPRFLEPVKRRTCRPSCSSWGASPAGVLPAYTHHRRRLTLREATEPWKAGGAPARRWDWFPCWGCSCGSIGLDISRRRVWVVHPQCRCTQCNLCTLRESVTIISSVLWTKGLWIWIRTLNWIRLTVSSLVKLEPSGGRTSMLTGRGRACGAPRIHSSGSSAVPTLLLQRLTHSRGYILDPKSGNSVIFLKVGFSSEL